MTTAGRGGLIVLAVLAMLGCGLLIPQVRKFVREFIPQNWIVHLNGYRLGYRADYDVRIPMPDGVELAATLYKPASISTPLATVLVMSPYGRLKYGEGLRAAEFFASHGYAVLVQDVRGKHDSGGEFAPWRDIAADGATTLDWIARQSWSNGKVGTWGCSALGETQFVLARQRHPAHAAMIPMGAGGAVGSAAGRYAYFGLFEGGVFQLASGFGWFLENGAFDKSEIKPTSIDLPAALSSLPLQDMVSRYSRSPNSFKRFVTTPLTDPWWQRQGYLSEGEYPALPALVINTWGDQTVGDTLAIAEQGRRAGRTQQHVVVGAGSHCHHEEAGRDQQFGDLKVANASQPYFDWYLQWFDHWLYGKAAQPLSLPGYLFYVLGEDRWLSAEEWPPRNATSQRWYLSSNGRGANSADGTGLLGLDAPSVMGADHYVHDPENPVPSRGGPLCCTGNPADRAGPVDQRSVENRTDVLVYTSVPLLQPLRIVGPIRATLTVSSSARDTDFVVRLVDVWPDGRAINIQEGALRARYRNGYANQSPLSPGQPATLVVDMRSIAYYLPAGHALRLDIASSSFPRLERNLGTGGNNFDETKGVNAQNTVHFGGTANTYLELPILP